MRGPPENPRIREDGLNGDLDQLIRRRYRPSENRQATILPPVFAGPGSLLSTSSSASWPCRYSVPPRSAAPCHGSRIAYEFAALKAVRYRSGARAIEGGKFVRDPRP